MPLPRDATGLRLHVGDRVSVRVGRWAPWAGTIVYYLRGVTVAWLGVRRRGVEWAELVMACDVALVARGPKAKPPPAAPSQVTDVEVTLVAPRRKRKPK